jgi:hypothetical protein
VPALSALPDQNDADSHLTSTPGYDLRAFECATCDRISTRLVPSDPMKAGDAPRWLNSELKPLA